MSWVMSAKGYVAMWIHLNVKLCHSSSSIPILLHLFQMSNVIIKHCTITSCGCIWSGLGVWAAIEFLILTIDYAVSIYVRLFQFIQFQTLCSRVYSCMKIAICNSYPPNKHLPSPTFIYLAVCTTYIHSLNAYMMKICFSSHLNMHTSFLALFYSFLHQIAWNWMTQNVQTTATKNTELFLDNNEVWTSIWTFIILVVYFLCTSNSLNLWAGKKYFFVQYFMNESLSTSLTLFIQLYSTEKRKYKHKKSSVKVFEQVSKQNASSVDLWQ
jgi:hypothetical protein